MWQMTSNNPAPPDEQEKAKIRRALGPHGCRVHAALLMMVADLAEIKIRLDPAAQALVGAQASQVFARARER